MSPTMGLDSHTTPNTEQPPSFNPPTGNFVSKKRDVVEERPGIIETSNIDPLTHSSSTKDEEGLAKKATNMASEAATKTYEMVTGERK
ncbi:hypothetical protein L218DRAFT_958004 [Marasmius fiardii PR-910]|nr:hypothetical protein L218DRAFT_958004 [Marasmius fiardii PR-910]